MSSVMKCDACGKIYEKSRKNAEIKVLANYGIDVPESYDICPECLSDFHDFIETKKNQKETPSLKVDDILRSMSDKEFSLTGIGFFEYSQFMDGVDLILNGQLLRILHTKPELYPVDGMPDITFSISEEYTVGGYMNIFDPVKVFFDYQTKNTESGLDKEFRVYNANKIDEFKGDLILAICTIHEGDMSYPHYVIYNAENLGYTNCLTKREEKP